MTTAELPVAILIDEPDPERIESAAKLLEQAAKSSTDGAVYYLLAMAHKRLGRNAEARAALRKITPPDADVWLQLGLLSLRDKQPAQAEQEFARAWEADPANYAAGFNLLLTRLTLEQYAVCAALSSQLSRIAPSSAEQRQMTALHRLLQAMSASNNATIELHSDEDGFSGQLGPEGGLADLTVDDEHRLIRLVRSLGKIDTALNLLKALLAGRAGSTALQEAYVEACLVKARELLDRSQWGEAKRLLESIRNRPGMGRTTQTAVLNLLGCACCLSQDFADGLRHFTAAAKLATTDARLQQNLAIVHEFLDRPSDAEPHWNRFFDLLDQRLSGPPGFKGYAESLAFEGLTRLAGQAVEKEKWQVAYNYLRRAHELRPGDLETMERLFQFANQLKRKDEALRMLKRLRELRPGEPQYDLFELDLIEVNNLNDVEKLLGEIDKVLRRYPNDPRVESRAAQTLGNVIPLIGSMCDQLTDQLRKVSDQVRHLPDYQINWNAVHDVMRELLRDFQKLRRITGKCLPLVSHEEQRRIVRDLAEHLDQKIEYCRSMAG